ncbi:MAG: hypothetical protein AAFY08_15060, partial [Planctomycetota bacterium]
LSFLMASVPSGVSHNGRTGFRGKGHTDTPFEIVVPFEAALPSTAAAERDADADTNSAASAVHRVGHGCGPPSAASVNATADASPAAGPTAPDASPTN